MAVLSHNRNTQKENKSQESAKGQIQGGAGDTVSTIENHGRKRGNTKSVSIEQVSSVLIFFSLRKKGEKTKAGKKKKSIAECPKDHTGRQDAELLSGTASWAPSARPGGFVADTAHARPSVLRWVGGKSLCSMKLQRAGDTLQAVQLPRAVLPSDVLPVGAARQRHHGAQRGGPLAHLHLEHGVLHALQQALVLLRYGQGSRVDLLVDGLPISRLKDKQPFTSLTHPPCLKSEPGSISPIPPQRA